MKAEHDTLAKRFASRESREAATFLGSRGGFWPCFGTC